MSNLKDVMHMNPICLKQNDTIHKAAQLMRDNQTGALPIVDDNNKAMGMLTDRDIVIRCVAEGMDVSKSTVKEAMSKRVEKVYEDEDLNKALDVMKKSQLHRLMVCDRNDRLVGIISMANFVGKIDTKQMGDLVCEVHKEKVKA